MQSLCFYNSSMMTYESQLNKYLLGHATQAGLLGGVLLDTPDIDEKWNEFADSFLADAVKEFNQYPEYVLACAGYLGMAVATLWDLDWEKYAGETYSFFQGENGFDDMDDYINDKIMGDPEYSVTAMQSCSAAAYHFLLHYDVEPGTVMAFKCFLSTVATMYKIGAAIRLHRLGYKFERVGVE